MTEEHFQIPPSYPRVLVISGPSGVGKDTIARQLIAERPDKFYFVVTATTRPPRSGEVHGYDYFFLTKDEFAVMIEKNDLLEYAIVYDDYKGIPKQQIRDALNSGRDVIMRVDVQGAATLRKLIPNAIFVYMMTESEEELVRRLRARRSENDDSLNLRIATARQELKRIREFDYFVVNAEGKQERTVQFMLSIIDAARCKVDQNPIEL